MENYETGQTHFDYIPYFSPNCNLCAERIASGDGDRPACAKHCGTNSIHCGDLEELAKKMEDMPRSVLYSPK